MTNFDYRRIDDVIHSRVRLAIMAFLMTAGTSDFREVKAKTGVSDGNLSTHLRKLEEAGYLDQIKRFEGRKPVTDLRLTEAGRKAFKSYLDGLADLIGPAGGHTAD